MKVSLLTNLIPPYRNSLFNEFNDLEAISSFTVYLCTPSEPNRNWDIPKDSRYICERLKGFSI